MCMHVYDNVSAHVFYVCVRDGFKKTKEVMNHAKKDSVSEKLCSD